MKNDNNILGLFSCRNNELFLNYFKENLVQLVHSQLGIIDSEKSKKLPESFLVNHIVTTLVGTIRWWADNGMKESPETITEYFLSVI